MRIHLPVFGILCVCSVAGKADDMPQSPRIDCVIMSRPQPHESDSAVIWYDDFDGPAKPYTEAEGELDTKEAFGGEGRSMLGLYEKGRQGRGNRKVFFGDSPTGKVVQKGKYFDDIYWRIYVKPREPRLAGQLRPAWHQRGVSGDLLEQGIARNPVPLDRRFRHLDPSDWAGGLPAQPCPRQDALGSQKE